MERIKDQLFLSHNNLRIILKRKRTDKFNGKTNFLNDARVFSTIIETNR